jgi:hypothetical protein
MKKKVGVEELGVRRLAVHDACGLALLTPNF